MEAGLSGHTPVVTLGDISYVEFMSNSAFSYFFDFCSILEDELP